MTAYSPEGKRQLSRNKVFHCLCGQPAIRKIGGGFWTCARCLELDAFVATLHEKAKRRMSEDLVVQP